MNSAETMCFLEVTLIYSSSKNDFLEVAVKSQKKRKHEFCENHVYSVNCNTVFSSKFRRKIISCQRKLKERLTK